MTTNAVKKPGWIHRLIPPLENELIAYAYLITHCQAKAFEAVHEAVCNALSTAAEPPDPRGWMFIVVRNQAFNILRYESRYRRVFSPDPEPAEQSGDLDERAWLDLAVNEDTASELRGEIEKLSDKLRVTVVMRYIDGLEYEQIAHLLGIPAGTVRARVCRAVQELREALGGLTARTPPKTSAQKHRAASSNFEPAGSSPEHTADGGQHVK